MQEGKTPSKSAASKGAASANQKPAATSTPSGRLKTLSLFRSCMGYDEVLKFFLLTVCQDLQESTDIAAFLLLCGFHRPHLLLCSRTIYV